MCVSYLKKSTQKSNLFWVCCWFVVMCIQQRQRKRNSEASSPSSLITFNSDCKQHFFCATVDSVAAKQETQYEYLKIVFSISRKKYAYKPLTNNYKSEKQICILMKHLKNIFWYTEFLIIPHLYCIMKRIQNFSNAQLVFSSLYSDKMKENNIKVCF